MSYSFIHRYLIENTDVAIKNVHFFPTASCISSREMPLNPVCMVFFFIAGIHYMTSYTS